VPLVCSNSKCPKQRKQQHNSPFRINVPEADLAISGRRIARDRAAEPRDGQDRSRARSSAQFQELVRYGNGLPTGGTRGKLNAHTNSYNNDRQRDITSFRFVEASKCLPFIVTLAAGVVIEQLKIIDPLTNPTAHGGRAEDAFDVVFVASRYGFSGKADGTRWDPTNRASWANCGRRLGTHATSRRAGGLGYPTPARMGPRVLRGCSPFTSICRQRSRPRWQQRSPAGPCRWDSQKKNALVVEALMTSGKDGKLGVFHR